MGDEVVQFAKGIEATDLKLVFEHSEFPGLFKRSNYFLYQNTFLIVKVSRSQKGLFWGLGKKFFDLFNTLTASGGNWFFVALVSSKSGWIISKKEIANLVSNRSLSYSEAQEEFKINRHNLKDENGFESIQGFLKRIAQNGAG